MGGGQDHSLSGSPELRPLDASAGSLHLPLTALSSQLPLGVDKDFHGLGGGFASAGCSLKASRDVSIVSCSL